MHNQLAQLAYQLINTTTVRGTDVEAVAKVKNWLQRIGSGELEISVANRDATKPEGPALAQRQAE